jgi:SAM-dependent methyltransferase
MKAQSIRRIICRVLRRPEALPVMVQGEQQALEGLETRDPWFYLKFVWAPEIIADFLGRLIPLKSAVVLDFGCGEGLMAKGVARRAREVHGVDTQHNFWQLEERFGRTFGQDNPFPPVRLKLVRADEGLPYEDGSFDGVYAWSVFEHVADVPSVLGEIRRVLRPGGAFFVQIEPLYCSPAGGHLWNILDEPWIHLKLSRDELIERIRQAPLEADSAETRKRIFQGMCPEDYRNAVIDHCLPSLNQITVRDLTSHARKAGFTIRHQQTWQDCPFEVPAELLELYPHEDLVTRQVLMTMTS